MQLYNYHSHTARCGHADPDWTDEDYVKEYIAAGYETFAFTDHAPEKTPVDLRPRIRMPYAQKDEYLASVRSLRERYADRIRILSGFEVEYSPGREEELFELKRETDILILGQHYVRREGEPEPCYFRKGTCREKDVRLLGEYVERAIELGLPDIIAHPDHYLLFRNTEFTATDAETAHRICRAAAEHDIPLEINLHNILGCTYRRKGVEDDDPFPVQRERMSEISYPRRAFWEIAAEYPVRVLWGMDVHRRGEIPYFEKLTALAADLLSGVIDKLTFTDRP
ncbi:MAG: histidinol-phosphatase [Clostridia bacterium]|nr:histidinol-phosphatase [Clostridia bacterium]